MWCGCGNMSRPLKQQHDSPISSGRFSNVAAVRVVDLYAGAGGLSLGFARAGCDVVLAVEAERRAARSYSANHKRTLVLHERIGPGWNLVDRLKETLEDPTCDILIGGPPCQGWSTLGPRGGTQRRALLNACVEHFVDQVRHLAPAAVVMENVRGLAVKDGGSHLRHVIQRLRRAGYRVSVHDVSAADFGVPQLRHRLFVVAVRSSLSVQYQLTPSHSASDHVSVWDAIGDLPSLDSGGATSEYLPAKTTFQRELRNGCTELLWHQSPSHSERTLLILRALRGEGASRTAVECEVELTSGFHNTYGRLWSDRPAPAVTSSAGRVSSGRNAHPFDDRALTPREAARLQTFPDSYMWIGERWPVYGQIGNAVPPILAEAIARPLVMGLQRAFGSIL
jgi:DNA (cytosine-5)-methyltransferase 1